MFNFILVVHLIIVLLMIGLILLQKSEAGGMVSSSNMGGLMSVRGSANFMTRTTAILAGLFFTTSLTLVWLTASERSNPQSILDSDPLAMKAAQAQPAPTPATVPTQSSAQESLTPPAEQTAPEVVNKNDASPAQAPAAKPVTAKALASKKTRQAKKNN